MLPTWKLTDVDTRSETQQLASDNYAGICPEALASFARANCGHAVAYGQDPWTTQAVAAIRELFATDCAVHFVFNGTAANSLALAAICQSYHSVICHELAHVETDECGGPEFFSNGSKLLLAPGEQGKLSPQSIEAIVNRRSDIHYPKPQAVSLTQASEVGTVYRPDEIAAICATARRLGLHVHMDGARFANAVATLGVAPKEISWQAGVDVLCLGGTKNGLALGEAVVFFNAQLAEDFAYRCKQSGQLASKMRFVSAQWLGLLGDGVWLRNARHANAMAQQLTKAIEEVQAWQVARGEPPLGLLYRVEANSLFLRLPDAVTDALRARGWRLYTFIGAGGVRLMTSWNTTPATVARFVDELRQTLASTAASDQAAASRGITARALAEVAAATSASEIPRSSARVCAIRSR